MKKKLMLFLLVISCVPLLLISVISMVLFDNNVKDDYLAVSQAKVEQFQFEIQSLLSKHLELLSMLASTPSIQTLDVISSKPILVEASRAFPILVPIVVDTGSGRQIVKSDDSALSPDISDRKFWQLGMKGQANISDTLVSKDNNHPIIVLATPIRSQDGSAVTGVLQGTIDLDLLIDLVSKESKDGGISYIVDREGKMIAHPQRELVTKREDVSNMEFIQKGLKGESGTIDMKDENGIRKIVSYAYNPTTGWVVVHETPFSIMAAKSRNLMLTTGTIVLVTIIIVILAGYFAAQKITRSLKMILDECMLLTQGDFRERETKIRSNDEIALLAQGFRAMRTSLRTLVIKVQSQAEQVTASSEELTASAEQSAQAANQVASSITEVAKGAEQQLGAANDTSAVVQQMSASIQQVAANANEVAGQSAQSADRANEGNKSVDKAVNQMAHIEQTVTASAQIVAKLGERSKEIGQIVDTISGIAGQTNLLALNAAIEAARAGEQGRGFAVVAEEVRKLAEQSQDAAKQIAALIGEIQADTDKAVVAMNDGTREVKLGAEIVNASGQSFQEITGLVTHVSGQVKEISSAIDQMAIGSQQIVESVKQIDKLSKTASGEAQAVSAATEEQSASMEEIASSSQALATLAQNLQAAVAKFRV